MRHGFVRARALALLLALAAGSARGQGVDDGRPGDAPAGDAQPADAGMAGVSAAGAAMDGAGPDAGPSGALRLTLDEAIDRALLDAFGLRVARNDLASSQSGLLSAENEFGLKLRVAFEDSRLYQRNLPIIAGPGIVARYSDLDEDQRFSFQLSKELKIGGAFEVRTDMTRLRADGASFDPLHSSITGVSWTIPLWAGRGRRVATAGLVSAETGLRQQARSLVEREMQAIVGVVRAFYQVLRSRSVLEIDRAAVGRAEENLRTYQLRLEEGLVTPIDVSRADRELKARLNAVVADEESLQAARDQLVQLLALPLDADLELVGEPVFAEADVDLSLATDEALANRADLRSQRESVELAELQRDVARNGTKPRVDLTLGATFHTLQGEDAGKWFEFADDDEWTSGFGISYTFGERRDNEALQQAIIAEDSERIRLTELQREIVLEVRDAVRGVRSLERQVELLQDNVRLAEESLRLAQLQLEEDLIRTTDLLQIQDELVQAQTERVNALYDHAVARVSLDLALGRYRVGTGRAQSPFLRDEPPVEPDVPVLPRVPLSGTGAAP